jgi:mono/diheme cytochrome c family protein
MRRRLTSVVLALAAISAGQAATPALERQFEQTVRPFVATYCAGCHSGPSAAAQFDLKSYTTLNMVTRDYPRWALVEHRLEAHEMPPKTVPQPPAEVRERVIRWIHAVRDNEIRRNAGDPGLVLARRLSNAEYNYTIRDLTGQDLQPTREFPVDPANPAGFDNSGESLTMSAALLNKYLQAARSVADHMVLTPGGIHFAPYPMRVETDREKYAIEHILDFYARQPTDLADYFQAAWKFEHRAELGEPHATLRAIAAEAKLSPRYLPVVWQLLKEKDAVGPIAKLQEMWRTLPANGGKTTARFAEMRDFVIKIRKQTAMQFAAPVVQGLPAGSQPLMNWKLRQYAAHRRVSDPRDLRDDIEIPPPLPVIPDYPDGHEEAADRWAAVSAQARATDPDLVIPAAGRARYEAAFSRFASVFPDAFYVQERGRFYPDDSEDKGRFLSAGYHNTMGFFRDDTPLQEMILDEKGRKELDRLWDEFDFVAAFTARTWVQYFFNQSGEVQGLGAESGTARPVDHEITDAAVILGLRDAYLAKAAADPANDLIAAAAIRVHFDGVNATLRRLEQEHAEAEPRHLEALLKFAARAYRRPLTTAERNDTLAYYRTLRDKNGLSHEDAIRDSIVSVLMSPDFLYRIDLLDARMGLPKSADRAAAEQPLAGYALASRLSYFLWSSMPDDQLLAHAAAGDLHRETVLLAQARRMLKDPRARGLATEFGGNWLDFRHFETNNTVDRARFPSFDNDLREAMFQEPIHFLDDVIHNDRSVLDMLYGDYTFVNTPLAKHYGMPEVKGDGPVQTWTRVDHAGNYQRGGLLPMAVFLTENAPGLRTSPVKRGYWVVRRVLGEVIPPPPPVVPELPSDEAKADLPLRDMLAKHRANAVCASCHARFDSLGLAFEGYGPVGEARTKDLAGRPVDIHAVFPGGTSGAGLEGVRTYIREHRQADFVDNLSRKLLAYALNRSLQLSDEWLIGKMETRLRADEYRFDSLVETIVTSPPFLNKRNPDAHQTLSQVR